MGDPISRAYRGNQTADAGAPPSRTTDNNPKSAMNSGQNQVLRLIVNQASEFQAIAPALATWAPKMNRLARERVFRHIVASTLDNPDHPYFSLVSPRLRQEMIEAITSELTDSHYLT